MHNIRSIILLCTTAYIALFVAGAPIAPRDAVTATQSAAAPFTASTLKARAAVDDTASLQSPPPPQPGRHLRHAREFHGGSSDKRSSYPPINLDNALHWSNGVALVRKNSDGTGLYEADTMNGNRRSFIMIANPGETTADMKNRERLCSNIQRYYKEVLNSPEWFRSGNQSGPSSRPIYQYEMPGPGEDWPTRSAGKNHFDCVAMIPKARGAVIELLRGLAKADLTLKAPNLTKIIFNVQGDEWKAYITNFSTLKSLEDGDSRSEAIARLANENWKETLCPADDSD